MHDTSTKKCQGSTFCSPMNDLAGPISAMRASDHNRTLQQVYALLDKARGILARQAALASEEVAARERFDFVDPGCR